jgi:predicted phage tail protein
MTELSIEGKLGRVFGSTWKLKVSNFVELFSALEANTQKLRNYLRTHKKEYWAIFVDGERVDADGFLFNNIKDKKIKIIPILAGGAAAIATAIVAEMGITSTIGALVVEFVLTVIISTAISYGISLLIAKLMKTDDPEAVNTTSFLFGAPENVADQGQVVPVGYGRIRTGSKVISVSSTNVDKAVWEANSLNDLVAGNVKRPVVGLLGGGGGGSIGFNYYLK